MFQVALLAYTASPSDDLDAKHARVGVKAEDGTMLHLPAHGANLCQALHNHCGPGRNGATCVKRGLELVLGNGSVMSQIRNTMVVSLETMFLCNPLPFDLNASTTARVQKLNKMLRIAVNTTNPTLNVPLVPPVDLKSYHNAARWSTLADWDPLEKAAHFMFALSVLPDNRHSVDRLAVALDEAAQSATSSLSTDGTDSLPRSLAQRLSLARTLLLHYAVLRKVLQHPLQRPLHLITGLLARTFWPHNRTDLFPWLPAILEPRNVGAMRRDLPPPNLWRGFGLEHQDEGVHIGGDWGEIHLIEAGRVNETNAALFPAIVDVLLGSGGDFINARLSVIRPNTHITPHCGVSNAKLRAHIGLRIPSHVSMSGITVGGTHMSWSEGEAFVFDDSFEHEVWWLPQTDLTSCHGRETHDAQSMTSRCAKEKVAERVVLIIDVWHPDLSEVERTKARTQFRKDLPGKFRKGEQVYSGRFVSDVTFGAVCTVLGRSRRDRNRIAVRCEQSGTALDLWPDELIRKSAWESRLPGGFFRGDSIVTRDRLESHGRVLEAGEKGLVVGQSGIDALVILVNQTTQWIFPHNSVLRRDLGYLPSQDSSHQPLRRATMEVTIDMIDPEVLRVDDFVSENEIKELLSLAQPLLQPSRLQGGESPEGRRTSSSAFLSGANAWHPTVLRVLQRAAVLAGIPWTHAEGIQIARYLNGEFFAEHNDWFPANSSDIDQRSGQRVVSVLVYLSDNFSGGHTVFPRLDYSVTPKRGRALFWRNTIAMCGGQPDPRMLHLGESVTKGVKWVANVWFTARPFDTYRTAFHGSQLQCN